MKKLIKNDSKETHSKGEERIIQILIDHALNPMAAPNCAEEIVNYVNKEYNNKVMLSQMFEK